MSDAKRIHMLEQALVAWLDAETVRSYGSPNDIEWQRDVDRKVELAKRLTREALRKTDEG